MLRRILHVDFSRQRLHNHFRFHDDNRRFYRLDRFSGFNGWFGTGAASAATRPARRTFGRGFAGFLDIPVIFTRSNGAAIIAWRPATVTGAVGPWRCFSGFHCRCLHDRCPCFNRPRNFLLLRLRIVVLRSIIGAIPTVLRARFAIVHIHKAEIMLGVLIHVLSRNTVAGGMRITRKLYVFFVHLTRVPADPDTGTIAIEALVPRGPITTSASSATAAAAARSLRTLTLSHITVT